MRDILFSIVVPVYKVPYDLLHRSIRSVINQTYRNLDIILVDDGSPDYSPRILDEYANMDPRVRVIHQENSGLSVVRNVGVNASIGEWVSFVDGDDYIEPNTYEEAARMVQRQGNNADVIAWDCIADFGDNPKLNFFFGEDCTSRLWTNKEEMIGTMLPVKHTTSFRYAIFDVTWARIYRRSLLVDNHIQNIPGLKRAQDLIFGLEVFEYAKGLYYESHHLYHYVLNDDAASRKYDPHIVEKMTQFGNALHDYVDKYHPGDHSFLQRMYVKMMPKIVECFSQYYVPYSKVNGIRKTLAIARKELEAPIFREAVENIELEGNNWKVRVFAELLRHRLYILLFFICKLQTTAKIKFLKK